MADSEVLKAVSTPDHDGPMHSYDPELERRAVRKLDYTLLPALLMFYIIFVDFTNYGNVRVAGMQDDLGMTDGQFQTSILVTFLPYIASQLPANLVLRKIGPGLLMPSLLTFLGIVFAFHGLITSYTGLLVARAFVGVAEGPVYPGIVLYLSGFYTRRELSLRLACFFAMSGLGGTLASLLAAGIENMDGVGGRAGWAWIFIIQGVMTIFLGIACFFLVPSTPRDSRFLTDEQKDMIMARLERDRPSFSSPGTFTIREVLRSLSSPHVIITLIMQFMSGTMSIGLAVFLPSIIREMGNSRGRSQLLSAGPSAAGFAVSLVTAFCSDRYNSRGIPMAVASGLAVIGFTLYLVAKDDSMAYGALYITAASSAITPILSAWMANNSEPYYRRATSVALGFGMTTIGGFVSTFMYPSKNGPKYRSTTILNLNFSIIVLLAALINMLYLSQRNKQKRSEGYRTRVLAKFKEEDSDGELKAWMELGDRHPDFVYTL